MVTVTHRRRRGTSMMGHHDTFTNAARMVMIFSVVVMVVVFYSETPTAGGEDVHAIQELLKSSNSSLLSIRVIDQQDNDRSSYELSFPAFTEEQGRQHILDLFQEAGVELTPDMEESLPTWSQIQEVVGQHPYIVGLEHCARYRQIAPPLERMLGPAGMFNSGTNLVTHLLKQNCEIPERRAKMGPNQAKESYGMRWQVPWGKHTPAKFRDLHATLKAMSIPKEFILPVVTLRSPYTWFRSMCKNPYTAKWKHLRRNPNDCPAIIDERGNWNNVSVHYGAGNDHHQSIAHLWNDWYSYYVKEASYPWIAIRMEDLVFYPKETIRAVCECAGGEIRSDQPFKFIVESAKADSPGHDASTGLYAAWIKYSKRPQAQFGFSDTQYEAAIKALDSDLMKAFGYHHPLSA